MKHSWQTRQTEGFVEHSSERATQEEAGKPYLVTRSSLYKVQSASNWRRFLGEPFLRVLRSFSQQLLEKPSILFLRSCTSSPMINFTRATLTLKEHNMQQSHLMAMEDSSGIMEGRQLSVQQQFQDHSSRQILKNREILKGILKVIIFCWKQNISLRGHWESMSSDAGNPGNFVSLLHLWMDAGDIVLKEHFSTAARNARYHSPTAQNELVAACGEWI